MDPDQKRGIPSFSYFVFEDPLEDLDGEQRELAYVWYKSGLGPSIPFSHQRGSGRKVTHSTGIVSFIIVSLPDDAAETICCSIDLLIFAVSSFVRKGVSPLFLLL